MIIKTVDVGLETNDYLLLGKKGEYNTTTIQFDCSYFVENFGDGNAVIVYQPSGETPYIESSTKSGNLVDWVINQIDTQNDGSGVVEVRWYVGESLAKSVMYKSYIMPSISGETDPPEYYQTWLDQLIALGIEVEQNAESAKESMESASASATSASASETSATTSAQTASLYSSYALQYKNDAQASYMNARLSEINASGSATNAANSAASALQSEKNAKVTETSVINYYNKTVKTEYATESINLDEVYYFHSLFYPGHENNFIISNMDTVENTLSYTLYAKHPVSEKLFELSNGTITLKHGYDRYGISIPIQADAIKFSIDDSKKKYVTGIHIELEKTDRIEVITDAGEKFAENGAYIIDEKHRHDSATICRGLHNASKTSMPYYVNNLKQFTLDAYVSNMGNDVAVYDVYAGTTKLKRIAVSQGHGKFPEHFSIYVDQEKYGKLKIEFINGDDAYISAFALTDKVEYVADYCQEKVDLIEDSILIVSSCVATIEVETSEAMELLNEIKETGESFVEEITSTGNTQKALVQSAGLNEITKVQNAGTTAVSSVETKKTSSISELTTKTEELKDELEEIIEEAPVLTSGYDATEKMVTIYGIYGNATSSEGVDF